MNSWRIVLEEDDGSSDESSKALEKGFCCPKCKTMFETCWELEQHLNAKEVGASAPRRAVPNCLDWCHIEVITSNLDARMTWPEKKVIKKVVKEPLNHMRWRLSSRTTKLAWPQQEIMETSSCSHCGICAACSERKGKEDTVKKLLEEAVHLLEIPSLTERIEHAIRQWESLGKDEKQLNSKRDSIMRKMHELQETKQQAQEEWNEMQASWRTWDISFLEEWMAEHEVKRMMIEMECNACRDALWELVDEQHRWKQQSAKEFSKNTREWIALMREWRQVKDRKEMESELVYPLGQVARVVGQSVRKHLKWMGIWEDEWYRPQLLKKGRRRKKVQSIEVQKWADYVSREWNRMSTEFEKERSSELVPDHLLLTYPPDLHERKECHRVLMEFRDLLRAFADQRDRLDGEWSALERGEDESKREQDRLTKKIAAFDLQVQQEWTRMQKDWSNLEKKEREEWRDWVRMERLKLEDAMRAYRAVVFQHILTRRRLENEGKARRDALDRVVSSKERVEGRWERKQLALEEKKKEAERLVKKERKRGR